MKRITAVLLLLTLVLLTVPVSAESSSAPEFPDLLTCSPWAAAEIAQAYNLALIPPRLAENWTDGITRAEFTETALYFLAARYNLGIDVFLNDVSDLNDGAGVPLGNFTDVNNAFVDIAYYYGIIEGRGGGIFDPDSTITREEAAKILYHTYLVYGEEIESAVDVETRYADSDKIEDWAKAPVAVMTEWDVMHGISETAFDPDGTYTREQCFLTFLRLYKNAPEPKKEEAAKTEDGKTEEKTLAAWEQRLEKKRGEWAFQENWHYENDKYYVLYWYQATGLRGNVYFDILYKENGGEKRIYNQLPNPLDLIEYENGEKFRVSNDGEHIYFMNREVGTALKYVEYGIDLKTAAVAPTDGELGEAYSASYMLLRYVLTPEKLTQDYKLTADDMRALLDGIADVWVLGRQSLTGEVYLFFSDADGTYRVHDTEDRDTVWFDEATVRMLTEYFGAYYGEGGVKESELLNGEIDGAPCYLVTTKNDGNNRPENGLQFKLYVPTKDAAANTITVPVRLTWEVGNGEYVTGMYHLRYDIGVNTLIYKGIEKVGD